MIIYSLPNKDNDEKRHQLIEFAEDYSKKSNTKLTK